MKGTFKYQLVDQGSRIIQSLVRLGNVAEVKGGQRHGTTEAREYWAKIRDTVSEEPQDKALSKKTKDSNVHQRTYKKMCKVGNLK